MLISLMGATSAKAGTAAYYATCHFIDQGGDNGGSVSGMPCYAVEGANVYSAFFHILWKDGVQTQMNSIPSEPFNDLRTGRSYSRLGQNIFSANTDGDVIVLENAEYTNDRYGINEPGLVNRL
jgi:hypothetical protein